MPSKYPDENNHKKTKDEPFGELVRSVNNFFNEKPVRGFFQTMDEFFQNPFPQTPTFHIERMETKDEIIIKAELPGVKREQIHIDILGNSLTISVENLEDNIEEDEINQVYKRNFLRERSSRTIALQYPINEKKVKASYRDGLLQIRIPQVKGKTINIEE